MTLEVQKQAVEVYEYLTASKIDCVKICAMLFVCIQDLMKKITIFASFFYFSLGYPPLLTVVWGFFFCIHQILPKVFSEGPNEFKMGP